MSIWRMNAKELSLFLANKGLSDTGQISITDNEITGQMLLEFCEDDIQDAFSVFKDRFTIRKVLRECKSAPSDSQSGVVISPTKLQTASSVSQIHAPSQKNFNQSQFSPPATQSHNKQLLTPISQNSVYSQNRPPPNRGVISLGAPEKTTVVPMQIHKNQAFTSQTHTAPPPSNKKAEDYEARSPSKELMSARVSSTDDYRHAQKLRGMGDDNQRNIYDCAVDALVSLSNKHTLVEHAPETHNTTATARAPNVSQSFTSNQPGTSGTQQPDASHLYGLNYDCTYAWNVMSQKVKLFTADDLLSKRSRFSRPTEAQRLGGILIRNAAHAAGVWKDAPCLHEISLPQRKEFFKFIVTLAPQLSNSQNILFTRLREALQNRRKYLLDKKLGKIQQRRKRSSSDLGLEISEAGSFIDLTDLSGDITETEMDLEDLSDVKLESSEIQDHVTVKTEADIKTE